MRSSWVSVGFFQWVRVFFFGGWGLNGAFLEDRGVGGGILTVETVHG